METEPHGIERACRELGACRREKPITEPAGGAGRGEWQPANGGSGVGCVKRVGVVGLGGPDGPIDPYRGCGVGVTLSVCGGCWGMLSREVS